MNKINENPGMITRRLPYLKQLILSVFTFTIMAFLAGCKSGVDDPNKGTMNFHEWAATPPMGWNSWDCYGPTVVEDEVKANADYMAKYLKKFGWQYIVVDIRWYVENDKSGGYNQTDPRYVMDEYGRYQPAVNRFPSATDGKGFKPLADYIHGKGLKFGIHIMRGISVEAVKKNTPVMGTDVKAQDIYSPDGQCRWLSDNYTVDSKKKGAQEYYNSLFKLYASWGLDFVKVDDLANHLDEIEMVRKAIDNCGRPIVLSISPGPSQPKDGEFLISKANMWRTVGDFWDNWPQLKEEFSVCERWIPFIGDGHFPDADMLPLGKIGIRAERGLPRMSGFTKDEQYTVMSLFAIFRSPLMFGGDLPGNDEFTLSLITNKDVLRVNQQSINNKLLFNNNDLIAWTADDRKTGDKYLALFNAVDQKSVDESKAVYKSDLITQDTPGQSVDIDIDINGAKKLYLVATYDGGDRMTSHNCDWIEPVLIKGSGTVKLTDINWINATSLRGEPSLNKTSRGSALSIDGKTYKAGINVNATSVIEYDLPEGVTRFRVKAGLDIEGLTGGIQQGAPVPQGQNTAVPVARKASAKFLVFVEDPKGPVPPASANISVSLSQLGLSGSHTVTNLWTGEKLGNFTDTFSQSVNNHGAGLYKIH